MTSLRLGLRVKAGTMGRNRRGHDLRRTFITMARTDGANKDILRWATHGPTADMMDVYSSFDYATVCAEVAKLNVQIRSGELLTISPLLQVSCKSPKAAPIRAKRWMKLATRTGFEPVLPA